MSEEKNNVVGDINNISNTNSQTPIENSNNEEIIEDVIENTLDIQNNSKEVNNKNEVSVEEEQNINTQINNVFPQSNVSTEILQNDNNQDIFSNEQVQENSNNILEQKNIQNESIPNLEHSKDVPKKKKNSIKKIICILIIVVLLGIIAFVTFYIRSPKMILSKTILDFYNGLSDNTNSTLKSILNNDIVTNKSTIEFGMGGKSFEKQGIEEIDLKLESEYIENKKDKIGYLTLESVVDSTEFINLDALLKDNKIYAKIKDVTDNYYYDDYEFVSLLNDKSSDDIKYILDIFKDNIVDNITKQDLKEEQTTIELDNKDTKVRKISLEISEDLINKILKDTLNQIKNDSNAKEILIDNLDISEEELTNSIDEILSDLDSNSTTDLEYPSNSLYYNIYVKGLNTTVKQELTDNNTSFSYSTYNDTKEINVTSNNEKIFNIKFIGNEKGQITGMIGEISITGTYEKGKLSLNIPYEDSEITISFEYNEEEITKDEEFSNNINILIGLNDNNEEYNIYLKIDNNYKKGGDIKDIDVKNSKKIDEITEEEIQAIQDKLLGLPIIEDYLLTQNQLNNNLSDDYYNEDYDF